MSRTPLSERPEMFEPSEDKRQEPIPVITLDEEEPVRARMEQLAVGRKGRKGSATQAFGAVPVIELSSDEDSHDDDGDQNSGERSGRHQRQVNIHMESEDKPSVHEDSAYQAIAAVPVNESTPIYVEWTDSDHDMENENEPVQKQSTVTMRSNDNSPNYAGSHEHVEEALEQENELAEDPTAILPTDPEYDTDADDESEENQVGSDVEADSEEDESTDQDDYDEEEYADVVEEHISKKNDDTPGMEEPNEFMEHILEEEKKEETVENDDEGRTRIEKILKVKRDRHELLFLATFVGRPGYEQWTNPAVFEGKMNNAKVQEFLRDTKPWLDYRTAMTKLIRLGYPLEDVVLRRRPGSRSNGGARKLWQGLEIPDHFWVRGEVEPEVMKPKSRKRAAPKQPKRPKKSKARSPDSDSDQDWNSRDASSSHERYYTNYTESDSDDDEQFAESSTSGPTFELPLPTPQAGTPIVLRNQADLDQPTLYPAISQTNPDGFCLMQDAAVDKGIECLGLFEWLMNIGVNPNTAHDVPSCFDETITKVQGKMKEAFDRIMEANYGSKFAHERHWPMDTFPLAKDAERLQKNFFQMKNVDSSVDYVLLVFEMKHDEENERFLAKKVDPGRVTIRLNNFDCHPVDECTLRPHIQKGRNKIEIRFDVPSESFVAIKVFTKNRKPEKEKCNFGPRNN